MNSSAPKGKQITAKRPVCARVARRFFELKLEMLVAALLFPLQLLNAQQPTTDRKVLIVYVSRTANTEAIAKMIHEKVDGKVVSLELKKPYPKDYQAIVAQVDHEN